MLLPLLLSLGFWQLDRAEEKRSLQLLFKQRQLKGPIEIEQVQPQQDLRYQPIKLRGHYINQKNLLLDNRIYQRRFGYEIITPLQLTGTDQIVLVNRGFLQGDISRRELPAIEAIEGEVELIGEVYVPQSEMMTLAADNASGWPRLIQVLDMDALAKEFGSALFPFSVRIQSPIAGSYEANWVVVNLQPEKHTGYAVQWFAMSATLIIIMVLANTNLWVLLKQRKSQQN
ncbi:SURF1 family protein [Oceanicoccus sp. KOV_DT_Chl]|uniref:SURF1 family protein n=1 Tax=Oceanicoccus sp. KOV_DT_Chl TaxID=1904639 RepID=UPI001F2373E1|nr:SURF1 family protein [Oceanicoccus sp. KOV_DT_Chl]